MKLLSEILKSLLELMVAVILLIFIIWTSGNIVALTDSRTQPRRDVTKITEVTETPEGDKTITTTTTEEWKNLEIK